MPRFVMRVLDSVINNPTHQVDDYDRKRVARFTFGSMNRNLPSSETMNYGGTSEDQNMIDKIRGIWK